MSLERSTSLERLRGLMRRARGHLARRLARAPGGPALPARLEALEARLAAAEGQLATVRRYAAQAFWHAMDRDDAAAAPSRVVTCPICDRAAPRDALEVRADRCTFGGGALERYVCPGCGCVFGPTKFLELPAPLVDLDYRVLYADYAEADTTAHEVRAFELLRPRRGAVYVDWGAGRWNGTVAALRARGFDVWGYEPSAGGAPAPFVVTGREALPAPVEGIFSNNLLEHLARPVEEFRAFHALLRPGGRMAHATPCYRYAYPFTRFHVVLLTGDAPAVLAERTGFRVVERVEDGEFVACVFERA